MSEEEIVENNFELDRDLLKRQKQAFEEVKIKIQQQQALWEEQKLKEEELKKKEEEMQKKEEELKKQEKEIEIELKKKEETDRNEKKTEVISSKNKLVINKNNEAINNDMKNTPVIKKDQGNLSVLKGKAPTTNTEHDADMIEAPKKKVMPQVPTLEPISGTVPKWPFTFSMSAKGSASSSTTPSTVTGTTADKEQEEIEDLVQQVTRHH